MRLLLAAVVLVCGCALPWGEFKVTGEITVAAPLVEKIPRENFVLFIVAKNAGGMPVAVRRIVNPHFPVSYELNKDDVLIPGYRPKGPLRVGVEMNSHGNVGAPVRGDFAGQHRDAIRARESRVHVVIDRQI